MEASQELEVMLAQASSSSSSTGANYMLIIAEEQQQQQQQSAAAGNGQTTGLLGVLAVDVGSGDIAYGLCSSMLGSSNSSSSSGSDNVVPLEAVLLSLSPAELVVCEPVSAATNRQLAAYMAGVAGRRCRLERPQQQQQQNDADSSREAAAGQAGSSSYLTAATLQKLSDFYGSGGGSSGGSSSYGGQTGQTGQSGQTGQPGQTTAVVAADQDPISEDLRFILSLPHLVLVALAGAISHLSSYGLTGVLRCTSGFRSFGAVGSNMLLDGNALRQLEVLAAGGPGFLTRPGCVW
jgi:hypothetical protein